MIDDRGERGLSAVSPDGQEDLYWSGKCYVARTKGTPHIKKNVFFRALPKLPPPHPQFNQVLQLLLDVKNNVLERITKPSNNDYDNDGSDNCN